jgi:hypothetical protein
MKIGILLSPPVAAMAQGAPDIVAFLLRSRIFTNFRPNGSIRQSEEVYRYVYLVGKQIRLIDALSMAPISLKQVRTGSIKATARGYAPGDLLKLYIYGFRNRVRSSRRSRHRQFPRRL